MFIKKRNKVEFKAGEPLVHLIPISEKQVEIKTHLVSVDEILKMVPRPTTYANRYNFFKKSMESETKKCPFGFGK